MVLQEEEEEANSGREIYDAITDDTSDHEDFGRRLPDGLRCRRGGLTAVRLRLPSPVPWSLGVLFFQALLLS